VLGEGIDKARALIELSLPESATEMGHADKHGLQNEALAQMVAEALPSACFAGRGALVLEYGCGRGALALTILESFPAARGLLIDRDTRRHKVEKRREAGEDGMLRLRMDISNFDLEAFLRSPLDIERLPKACDFDLLALSKCTKTANRLEELWRRAAALQVEPWPPSALLACAKHLCGSATDISLRSLAAAASGAGSNDIDVLVCCATCCHQRCDANSYVNFPFLQSLGLCHSAEEFADFASTCGWALGSLVAAQRRLGLMSKRILDLGRIAWLRQELGLTEAHLSCYIGKEVTPENVAIIATGRLRG